MTQTEKINTEAKKNLNKGDEITIKWHGGSSNDPKLVSGKYHVIEGYKPFGMPEDKLCIEKPNGFIMWGDFCCQNIDRGIQTFGDGSVNECESKQSFQQLFDGNKVDRIELDELFPITDHRTIRKEYEERHEYFNKVVQELVEKSKRNILLGKSKINIIKYRRK